MPLALIRLEVRDKLIAEAVAALLNGRETNVQYKHCDQLDWRTPTLQTQMVVFQSKSIEWRMKPEPVTKYCNLYSTGDFGIPCSSVQLTKDGRGLSGAQFVGVVKVTFEDGKDPVFEFVKA